MVMKRFKRGLRTIYNLFKLKVQDWKRLVYYQYFPEKPLVINLNANDICNSKCTMCNIWQRKLDIELSPEEFKTIFENDLYSEVRHVGITGGEPTLRDDLPDLYESACKKLPKLTGLSIITNAIKPKDVIAQILKVYEVCNRYQKHFSIMVSLDGYGAIHDKIRGREGNFDTAMEVINYFRTNSNIPISIGCTISKENVWEVDTLLDFLKRENLYGRFRLAEFIKRLYNDDRADVIRNFTEEEKFHLQCFFQKLILTFEKDETYQRTYQSIINMLGGGKRLIACPYQSKGVVLDSRGDIHYCAPKSAKIGNALTKPADKLYKEGLAERRRILSQDCEDCVHDYHASITFDEKIRQYKNYLWRSIYKIDKLKFASFFKSILLFNMLNKSTKYNVFIVGWYGTETVGDKAILGGIINSYISKYGNRVQFLVSSIYPFITEKSIRELKCDQAVVVPFYSFDFVKSAATADETIMGGGPLMDTNFLSIPLWAFRIAKLFKKKTYIYGCGLGPLHQPKYISAVNDILKLSDEIKLRDYKSIAYAKNKLNWNKSNISYSGDYAQFYIEQQAAAIQEKKQPILACFLREWTDEYQGNYTQEEFLRIKLAFETNLSKVIKTICKENNLKPAFYPMHSFVAGNDDRDFYRIFLSNYFKNEEYILYKHNARIDETIEAMKSATINLCMRFHSVLFASTLNTNFLAIDYTNGGKITGFLEDKNQTELLIELSSIANGDEGAIKHWTTQAEKY